MDNDARIRLTTNYLDHLRQAIENTSGDLALVLRYQRKKLLAWSSTGRPLPINTGLPVVLQAVHSGLGEGSTTKRKEALRNALRDALECHKRLTRE